MQNRTIRIWQGLVLLLVLCNIGLVTTMWVKSSNPGNPPHETVKDFLIRKLNFSPAQRDTYSHMADQHHQSMMALDNTNRELKKALFENLKYGADAQKNVDSLAQLAALNEKSKDLVTFKHFSEVRAVCDEKQKAIFDDVIQEALMRMSGPPHGRHPGDGPPGPEHEAHGDEGDQPPPPGP